MAFLETLEGALRMQRILIPETFSVTSPSFCQMLGDADGVYKSL